jgi:hypothetical protein
VLLRLPVEVTGLHSALAASIVLAVAGALRSVWSLPIRQVDGERSGLDPGGS